MTDNLRGIVAIMVAMAAFIANDIFVKLASSALPLGEIMFVRGLLACALLLVWAVWSGAWSKWRLTLSWLNAWRSVGEISGTVFYLIALFNMKIANVNAIMQTIPLALTAGAALFLKEPIGWRRWIATLVGFAGVLLVVQPGGANFNTYSVFTLASVFCIVLRDLVTRVMGGELPTVLIALSSAVVVCAAGAVLFPFETWTWPTLATWANLTGSAVMLVTAYVAVVVAMRSGDVAVVSPFRYTVIVWAVLAGYLVWGELPDRLAVVGTAIIVAAGLYTLYRERVRRLEAQRSATLPSAA